jgi:hypothetical protein
MPLASFIQGQEHSDFCNDWLPAIYASAEVRLRVLGQLAKIN